MPADEELTTEINKRDVFRARNILFAILPALILFALAEAAARILPPVEFKDRGITAMGDHGDIFVNDPLLMWRVKPNLKGLHSTNSGGFRGGGFPSAPVGFKVDANGNKHYSEFRILVLGDSTMWGWGVKDGEYFAARLRNEMVNHIKAEGKFRGWPEIEVFDGGVPGYTSYQGWLLFQSELASLKPALVLTYFGVNDCHVKENGGRDSDRPSISPGTAAVLRILNHSRIYTDLRNILLLAKSAGNKKSETPVAPPMRRVPPEEYHQYMENIKSEAAAAGAKVINITPVWNLRGVMRDDVDSMLFTKGKGTLVKFSDGAPVYSHEPSLRAKDAFTASGRKPSELFLDYCHFSPLGHDLLAKAAAKRIVESVLIP